MKKTFVPRFWADMPRRLLLREVQKSLFGAFAVCFVVFACAACAIPLHNEPVVPLCDSTVRLRVVANSQNERDNRTKLAVRDALLENAKVLFADCRSAENARLAIRTNLFSIEKIAQKAARDSGSTDDVRVHFGYERAPVRRYGAYTFPADDYLTLRVDIGRADGRNWWCVLYPPLCLRAAGGTGGEKDEGIRVSAQNRRALEEAGVSKSAADMLSDGTRPRIRLKLRLVEIIEALFGGV